MEIREIMKSKAVKTAVTVVGTLAAGAVFAQEEPTLVVDYNDLITFAYDQLSPAVQNGLKIGGGVLGLTVGWRVLKRFTK